MANNFFNWFFLFVEIFIWFFSIQLSLSFFCFFVLQILVYCFVCLLIQFTYFLHYSFIVCFFAFLFGFKIFKISVSLHQLNNDSISNTLPLPFSSDFYLPMCSFRVHIKLSSGSVQQLRSIRCDVIHTFSILFSHLYGKNG